MRQGVTSCHCHILLPRPHISLDMKWASAPGRLGAEEGQPITVGDNVVGRLGQMQY
jgi:hypothetical protein